VNILGINSIYHESSAAIVVDGRVAAAAEEERFNRVKHAKPASVGTADVVPVASIGFCLEAAGLRPSDIDLVACSFDPELRETSFRVDPLSKPGDWGSVEGERLFRASVRRVPESLSAVLGEDVRDRFTWVPHHVAHAASAYYPCGDSDAGVLVVDGIGESGTAMFAGGVGTSLKRTGELVYPHSVGFVWEKLSAFLGFSSYDASKVMGLAAYGDPLRFSRAMADIAGSDGSPVVRPEVFAFRLDGFEALESLFGARRRPGDPLEQRHSDLAAALQNWNDSMILGLAERVYELHPAPTLCYSGGVALNCTTNWLLKEKGPFTRVYIPAAPHDAGTAVGAALWAYYRAAEPEAVAVAPDTPYTGPEYGDDAILRAFDDAGVAARRCPDIARDVAERIAAGQVVGWFQGRMELGPRAPGQPVPRRRPPPSRDARHAEPEGEAP
jgi:carbamoyltransferase